MCQTRCCLQTLVMAYVVKAYTAMAYIVMAYDVSDQVLSIDMHIGM